MRLPVFSWLFLMAIYSLFLSICVFGLSGQCIGNQQSLLLQLKNNLTFDPALSKKLVKWTQSVDCCSWEGVTCNEGSVIGLDLADESIWSTLDNSSSLFYLRHLHSLNLADNYFDSSQIPSDFGKLANLSYLNLSNAGFAGQIPTAISRLKRLVTLDLSINSDPYETASSLTLENPNLNMLVQNLSELIELYLDGVVISAQGKEWCRVLSSSLPNLRVLSLSKCNLSGPIDSSLQNLQSLSIIRLNDNNFSAPVPEFFADFKNLTSLNLSNSGLNGKFPEKIFSVQTLQMLDLSYNGLLEGSLPEFPPNGSLRTMLLGNTIFFGTLPPSIGNFKMLSTIDISHCNFNGSIPSSMVHLTKLVYLDMSYNNFNGSIPIFSMTKNMEILDLSGNSLSGQIPICLFSLPSLRELLLSNNQFSGQINKFSNISSHLLETLDLSRNNLEGPICLFSLPSLRELRLSNNRFSGQINKFSNISSHLLETLDLSSNNLEGPICLFSLPSLRVLLLSNNQFSGQINKCSNISSHLLERLDLSSNNLEGPIPIFFLEFQSLKSLSLSSNHFNSSLQPSVIQQLKNLSSLDLSHNKLKTFPDFLRNLSSLQFLSLSDNQIYGEIPNWLWKLHNLNDLDLSHNFLATLEGHITHINLSLLTLNLHSNQLRGQLPIISFVNYLDLSRNNFHSSIPASIGWSLASTSYFSLSCNKLYGSIPGSICNATNLELLDLSNNSFSGTIPECLIAGAIEVLDLSTNNLNGTISNTFQHNCRLRSLALNGNQLGGELSKYLANCKWLEFLDVGHNRIEDTFPFYLKNASYLEFLVLRSNKFYGSIAHLNPIATWPLLQIVDIALNNFTGRLPIIHQSNWAAMMDDEEEADFMFGKTSIDDIISYQSTVRITIKGSPLETQIIHTTLDFSCNKFDGPIPEEIGELTWLNILNLSHNALTGQIQPSLGKLRNLESLDLSSNELSGKIPVQLADGLIFLSVLNLSFNQLVGPIPFIKQFATFPETSFKGNERLCGLPLNSKCTYEKPRLSPPTYEESHSNSRILIEWNYISAELGFIFGFGIVIGPLMFWKRWRTWYYKHVDDILFKIFPKLYLGNEYRRR